MPYMLLEKSAQYISLAFPPPHRKGVVTCIGIVLWDQKMSKVLEMLWDRAGPEVFQLLSRSDTGVVHKEEELNRGLDLQ